MKNLLIMSAVLLVFASCGGDTHRMDSDDSHSQMHAAEGQSNTNRINMNEKIIKNIDHGTVVSFADQVGYLPGQVVSKTMAQNSHHSLTLFSFDKGEEISTHDTPGDAMVIVLDGTGKITLNGIEHILNAGEAIVMPANAPHAVFAVERFKMLLTVLYD